MRKVIILFLLIHVDVFGQKIIHYTTENGLPHDMVYNSHQDSKGYLWIGTDNGLARFNGKKFKIYNEKNGLTNNYVIDIKTYNKDTLVLATWGGGLHFLTKDTILKAKGTKPSKINELVANSNNIYSYIAGSTIRYVKNPKEFKPISIAINASKELIVKETIRNRHFFSPRVTIIKDEVYLHNRFLKRAENGKLKGIFRIKENEVLQVFPFLDNTSITTFTSNKDNYYASTNDTLIHFNKERILFKEKLLIRKLTILKIVPYKNSKVLILAADDNGFKEAFEYDINSKKIIDYRKEYNIKPKISDISIDFEKNIWLTTNGEGVYQIPNYSYNIKTIYNNIDIHKLISFEGKIYGLNPNQLLEFKEEKHNKSFSLKGFGKYLSIYKKKLQVNSYLNTLERKITSRINETKGVYSFFSKDIKIVGTDTTLVNGKRNLQLPSSIKNACDFNGKIYFATDFGMFVYNKKTKKISKTEYSLLRNNSVTDIVSQNNYLWVSTTKGLYKLKDNKITYFNTNHGIISNSINDLLVSSDNKLWIATAKGVSVFDGTSFVNLTKNQNLPSNNINNLLEDIKGNIWIATVKGLAILFNSNETILQNKPIINIQKHNNSFTFDVISYNSSNTIFTQYQINKDNWKVINSDKFDFTNFKEGNYTFKIRAKKPNSLWAYSNEYNFTVELPFYQKKSFISTSIISTSLLIIFIISYRLRKSKQLNLALNDAINKQLLLENKLNKVRDSIAQDFHDDLGNKLASITVLTDILSKKIDVKESLDIIKSIQENSDSLYKGTRDFIWSLKKESDQLEELITYISDFGEEFFSQLNISFKIDKKIDKNIKLPYYWSRHLILIFKEVMTNAAKHSKCKECLISFSFKNDKLIIKFLDDGLGFDLQKNQNQNGLININKRAKKIGGEIEIKSSPIGTSVVFIANSTQLK